MQMMSCHIEPRFLWILFLTSRILVIELQDLSQSVMQVSKGPDYRIFAGICFIILLPFIFVMYLFEIVGIADIIFPILIPIFVGIIGFMFLVVLVVMMAVRCATNTETATRWTRRGYTTRTYGTRTMTSRPVFQIPMNCPSCQREIELDRVEWRDRLTVVCSGCFADIPVESSHKR